MSKNRKTRQGIKLGLLLSLAASPALAQDLSPIQTMLESVESALTGPIGISVATLAVTSTGFMCMMGRLNWVGSPPSLSVSC